MLLPLFAELLSTHDRVVHDVKQVANAEAGSISIAVVPFLAEEWFPTLLLEFLAVHPGINVTVCEEWPRQIHRLVAEGTVDIGICASVFDDPNLRFHPVAVDTFGIGCADTHPLARNGGAVTWKALNGERLIGNDSFATLKLHGLGDRVEKTVMWVSSRPSLMNLLRRNVGITLMPRLTKPEWAKGVAFVPLVQPRVTRQIGIMTRQGQTLLPAATNMLAMVAKSLRDYATRKGAAACKSDTDSIVEQSDMRSTTKTAATKVAQPGARSRKKAR
jgi:DNA-binding transcriptional LysR family regulator